MGDLSVVVRLNGDVVEDRVVEVERLVRIGEAQGAVIPFPGADIAVVRMGDRLAVRGRTLEEGEELELFLGPVEVHIEHTVRARLPPEWAGLWDRRFLAAALLVVAAGTWIDAAEAWLDRQPPESVVAVTRVRDLVRAVGEERTSGGSRAVAMPAAPAAEPPPAPPAELADGPRHEDDDRLTRMGWAAWYRQLVPDDDDQLYEAQDRFAEDLEDAWARRVLARWAYDHDDPDQAAWHYAWLVQRYPDDSALRLRLARAEQRRGHHQSEIGHYDAILERDPAHAEARAGLAVALARMNRLDEAATALDQLQYVAPESPTTELTVAQLAAMAGQDRRALEALERAFSTRSALSDEGQLELRRTLALDPVFASLRRDPRLRSLIYRHLGAAGVRPMR
jgi:tetratricopeptide (TPR) repeat protein